MSSLGVGVLWVLHEAAILLDPPFASTLGLLWGVLTPLLLLVVVPLHPLFRRLLDDRWARVATASLLLGLCFLAFTALTELTGRPAPGLRFLSLMVGIDLCAAGFIVLGAWGLLSGRLARRIAIPFVVGPVGFVAGVGGRTFGLLPDPVSVALALMSFAFAVPWFQIARTEAIPPAVRPIVASKAVRRALLIALVVPVLLAPAFVGYVSHSAAASLLRPAREASSETPANHSLPFEVVRFPSRDGTGLFGWWMPANGTPRCTIVFFHGWSDHLNQSLEVAPFLHEAGYAVLAFDFRAHGQSGGSITTLGVDEVQDGLGAVDFAASRTDGSPGCIGLIGYSMGAATALRAAAEDPRVRFVVADSAFARIQHLVNNVFTYQTCKHFVCLPKYPFGPVTVFAAAWTTNRPIEDSAPIESMPGLARPTLLIQGEEDFFIDPDQDGRALAAASESHATLWFVPGAKHVEARKVAGDGYVERVLSFLAQHAMTSP